LNSVETPAKTVVADETATAEKVSLNNVMVDNNPPPNLDSSGSTAHDADESEASSEADVDEGSPTKDSPAAKKHKKISNYSLDLHVSDTNNFCVFV